ncbi:MAG: nucleoside kinase [Clostridiales bacterium]|nr:nucleoside kinase [Clostridiales bacterium]
MNKDMNISLYNGSNSQNNCNNSNISNNSNNNIFVDIYCSADGKDGNKICSMEVVKGTPLSEIAGECKGMLLYPAVAARVNNDIRELSYTLDMSYEEAWKVEFIDVTDEDGMRIYTRSLYFLLVKAVNDLYPNRKVKIMHSISKGIYCEAEGAFEQADVEAIVYHMRELTSKQIPFVKRLLPSDEAIGFLKDSGRIDRFHAIEHRTKPYVTIYNCGGLDDYFYGYMVPHTGYLEKFTLTHYFPGLILRYPLRNDPEKMPPFVEQKKLFDIFYEFKNWLTILEMENIGALNDIIKAGRIGEFIRISEALQEKRLAMIADVISKNDPLPIVFISGPSSSGKTTFSKRLSIQLRVNGLKPHIISLDDYFVSRDKTPRDENGDFDYESVDAIDVPLFNSHLALLREGREVDIPVFDFISGSRKDKGYSFSLGNGHVLIIEGIHALNERISASVPREEKLKLYVSALTSMNIDDHNRIPSTDTRLLRRMVRDNRIRGIDPASTLKRWPSVRRGEEKYIFPYQEDADIMFNSALLYEFSILKTFAEPQLQKISKDMREYSEARRLLEFLSYFLEADAGEVPPNSILREFIGNCCFID